jgi:hypothetical protein
VRTATIAAGAERKLGGILYAAKAAGQITKAHNPKNKHDVVDNDIMSFTLKQAGISRDLSSRAQRIADVSSDEFEKVITAGRQAGKLPDTDNVSISKPKQGTSRAYTLARLSRERPDLYERVKARELSANAAATIAGWRPSGLDQLRRAWRKASAEERRIFLEEAKL